MSSSLNIVVVRSTLYLAHSKTVSGDGGMYGQLTEIEYVGRTCFVREADTRTGRDSFTTSSGERWGMKIGKSGTSKSHQILELCAPADVWHEVAQAVQQIDALHRPVMANKRFSDKWANTQFRRAQE